MNAYSQDKIMSVFQDNTNKIRSKILIYWWEFQPINLLNHGRTQDNLDHAHRKIICHYFIILFF